MKFRSRFVYFAYGCPTASIPSAGIEAISTILPQVNYFCTFVENQLGTLEGNGNPPLSLPGKSYGQRSLVGCSRWGRKEWYTTEQLTLTLTYLYESISRVSVSMIFGFTISQHTQA